eukprot:1691146-Pleurochrysis_carterae.AAC.1
MLERSRAETEAGAAVNGIDGEGALQARVLIRGLANAAERKVVDLLAKGVVISRAVVRGVPLAGDE